MKTILFQGDSITDNGRSRENDIDLGLGYPTLVKAELGYNNLGEYTFYNRSIGGFRVVDLYSRIKCDFINLKPDYISILVGVNDVWHEYSMENGLDEEKYIKIYSMLIEEVKEALPEVKIMIMEPFILNGYNTAEWYDEFRAEIEKRAKRVKEMAKKYNLSFIPLQEKFDIAAKKMSPDYWLYDGVHPTIFGHELIKQAWLEEFDKIH